MKNSFKFHFLKSTKLQRRWLGRYAPAMAYSLRFMPLPHGMAAFSALMQNDRNSATSTTTTRNYGKGS